MWLKKIKIYLPILLILRISLGCSSNTLQKKALILGAFPSVISFGNKCLYLLKYSSVAAIFSSTVKQSQ